MGKRYTFEDVVQFVAENSDCRVLSDPSEFYRTTSKLRFECACGNEFITDLHHFRTQHQRQCPSCGSAKSIAARRLSRAGVVSRLSERGLTLVDDTYKNNRTPVTVICRCGHPHTAALNTLLSPTFSGLCTKCSLTKQHDYTRRTVDWMREYFAALDLTLLSDTYENARTPLTLLCSCGREFVSSYDVFKSGAKRPCCRYCSGRISSGEKAIATWLSDHKVQYEREKSFAGCGSQKRSYRFDFYVPGQNLCIEFDGIQHFKPVDFSGHQPDEVVQKSFLEMQKRDLEKDTFCERNNIKLVRIRYDEADHISDILESKLIPR